MRYVKPPALEEAASALAALGHPVRLQIVAGLLRGDCNVGRMADCLKLPQPQVSRHLAVLRDAGVLEVIAEGRLRRYRVCHPAMAAIVRAIIGELPEQGFEDEGESDAG